MKLPKIIGDSVTLAESLLEELKRHPGLTNEAKRLLEDKYRLEWNYHSNHIEGNTLTYGQTELLLFKGRAVGDHEKRYYDEMQAHDLAIDLVEEWSQDKTRDLTEADLRELNKIILVRPFWKSTQSIDGQETRKKIIPGEYKTLPNSVLLKNGRMHHFASPEETPARMEALFKWYQSNTVPEPIVRAAFVHHEMTSIHPFDDGNGRVARLWANFILIREGYPPLIIRSENKDQYLSSLEMADSGDLAPFIDFLAEEMIWSIDLSIKAAKGESIDEPGDVEKRIDLLDRKIRKLKNKEALTEKTDEVVWDAISGNILPILIGIDYNIKGLKDHFNKYSIQVHMGSLGRKFESVDELMEILSSDDVDKNGVVVLNVVFWLEGFKKGGVNAFTTTFEVNSEFNQWNYKIGSDNNVLKPFLYGEELPKDQIQNLVSLFTKELIFRVDQKIDQIKDI